MSGHSHWASIKHKKGAVDAKKGKAFSKLARYIMIAAKQGGSGDPNMNIRLLYAVEKAKASNMPRENIERAIKKGTGELEGTTFEETLYEGYGPGGAAVMLDILTDNKNRTLGELRKIFDSHGATTASANAVAWQFEKKGLITISAAGVSEDQLISDALDGGADNVELSGDIYEVTAAPSDFEAVKKALTAKKYKFTSCELTFLPKNYVPVNEHEGKKWLTLIEHLEDHDDVQNVYANFELPESMVVEK